MTRAEGEIFFKRFHGHHYHMWHDEPAKYKEYCKLHITKMTENKWRLQKISDLFADIQAEPASARLRIGSIIDIMHALKKIPKDLPEQLLDALDFATTLDIRQRILIMEHMEGRNDKDDCRKENVHPEDGSIVLIGFFFIAAVIFQRDEAAGHGDCQRIHFHGIPPDADQDQNASFCRRTGRS